ncbi:MAG: tRNA pseudouridine(38-40) synthase TruA [Clostridia bacterium]|nr:tRNA pseudouridine(38-40) synthase TruA [Clostridia bacterium]
MAQFLLTLAYNGTQFAGFQVQKNARTVQSVMQDAIEVLYGSRLPVVGCSRTDAGVHARDYKLTYHADDRLKPERIPAALNAHLPDDIAVKAAAVVPDDFHVRHDVYEKEYEYVIVNTPYRDPFSVNTALHYRRPLDADLLDRAAQAFVGTYDFRAFMASGSDIADTTRTVRSVSVTRAGDYVYLRIAADGFLYNMVRIFVGTMLAVAEGKVAPDALPGIIDSRDRKNAGITVPAHGLYLNRVVFR